VDFLSHFPYPTIRDFQEQTLQLLAANWEKYEVFCIVAPTAYGKTALARTVLNAVPNASYIVPTNMLVDQMIETFPDTRTLRRLDSYWCEEWGRPCPATKARMKSFCKGCQCGRDVAQAKYRNGPGVYTYHAYLAHRLYRKVLIVDEAHQMIPMIQSMGGVVLWQHDYKYPSSAYTVDKILQWAEKLPAKKKEGVKVAKLLEQLKSSVPDYSITRSVREFNGKGTQRGQPEDRDCIVMSPLHAREHAGRMWPRGTVEKLILLSATIGPKDIESLGLTDRRVAYIHSPSPIPASNRPFVLDPIAAVARANLAPSTEAMAKYIDNVLAPQHEGERGLIHATYQMSEMLRSHLTGSRYIFHDKWNKREKYEEYINTPGSILIACGLYEGINLPDDLGRWQVITKIPWKSLGDPAIKAMADRDEEWYLWETAKTTVQAAGRVCRHENDYGVTYCLDKTFDRLYSAAGHLLPQWFKDCIVEVGVSDE
jgi:ATP-dependent DNA helicase DinG